MGESVENKPVGTWFGPNTVAQVSPVLWIRDIWIRIRGSLQRLMNPDPALFVSDVQDAKKKVFIA
jgi:hypothetical protein